MARWKISEELETRMYALICAQHLVLAVVSLVFAVWDIVFTKPAIFHYHFKVRLCVLLIDYHINIQCPSQSIATAPEVKKDIQIRNTSFTSILCINNAAALQNEISMKYITLLRLSNIISAVFCYHKDFRFTTEILASPTTYLFAQTCICNISVSTCNLSEMYKENISV